MSVQSLASCHRSNSGRRVYCFFRYEVGAARLVTMMSCAEDAEACPLVGRIKLSRSSWRGSDSASAPPVLPPLRISCGGSLGIGITFSGSGAVPGAAFVCFGGVGLPERPAAELGHEDAGVRGAVAGDGFAPRPLPGALAFARLKR